MKRILPFLIIFLIGCASGITGMLRLQDRELLIHPDKPGLGYPHKVTECVDRKPGWRWLGKKCSQVHKDDFYDLNDTQIRKDLINAGFTCKSKMRFKY